MNESISRRVTILGIAASILILPAAAQYGGDRAGEVAGTWIGEVQKRKYTVDGDQLQWVGIVGTGGGTVVATLKRVK